jgi:hypothetical protein
MASRELDESYCVSWITSCRQEAYFAKQNRMRLNQDNYDMYHLQHNFDHKLPGQSREVLSKVRNAVESSKAFFQQALADLDDWYRITARTGDDEGTGMPVTPQEMQKLQNHMLKRCDYFSHVGAQTQLGLLGSLAVSEVGGQLISKPKFKTKAEGRGSKYKKHVVVSDDKSWELKYSDIRQEDYYPDPTGNGLYKIKEAMVDMYMVQQLAEGDDAIYDKAEVAELKPWGSADLQEDKKAHETGQNQYFDMRPRVKITEFWGNIVDNVTGELMAENIVMTMANDSCIIRKPTPNPLWHQKDPIIAAALIEVANSVWGIAMMDAGTKHNQLAN